jgi:epidermal growth factor receptor substrate 15
MKQIVTFLLFLLLTTIGLSQGQVQVEIDVKVFDYVTDKKIAGANVEVFDGGTSIKSGITPSNGNIKFTVPAGKKYKVEVSKPGKVSRYFLIDAKGIEAELIQGKNKVLIGPDIKLFDQVGNVDYSFIENNPITEFYFDLTSNSVEYDQAMANKMAKKIESLIAEAQKKEGQNDALYQKAIEGADGWYKEKKYDLALAKYEEASLLKPKEQYPKDRIKELDAIVKSQKQANLADKQKEEQYKALIASGDALRDQKKYAEAVTKYQEALKIKDEQYAKDQINNANKLIEAAKAQAEIDAKYKSIITSADMYFNQKSFAPAKDKYQEALGIKPNDEYAKKRIAEIDSKQGSEEKKKKYAFYIAEGDELKAAKKYEQAKEMYNQAIAIDNTQQYPKDRIKELDVLIADAEKNSETAQKFNAIMKQGDDLMAANKLIEAKAKYTEAGLMDPSKTKPKENIKKIDDILQAQADAKKNKAKIAELLKDGNAKFAKNDLSNAKLVYQEVLKLESTNAEASSKLKEINAKENQLQSQTQLEEKFKNLKAKGIEQYKAENYNEAQQLFSEAKAIKTDKDIDKYLSDIAGNMANEQVFQKLIQEAKALESTNVDAAITKYKEALGKKPSSETTKAKINELEKNKANQAEIEKKYQAALKKGNDALTSKKYQEAIQFYKEASTIKPSEKEPIDKIAEVKKLEDAALATKISSLLKDGNNYLSKNDFEKAKASFNEVLKVDPTNTEATAKLKEIALKENQLQTQAQQEQKFKSLKEQGISQFKADNLKEAKQSFTEAKLIKADVEIEKYLVDIDTKIANEQAYLKLMDEAKALELTNIDGAISKYKEALLKKPSSDQAKAKILELEKLKENKTNQAEIDKKYLAAMKKGNEFFIAKKYLDAIKYYNEALIFKPNEKEPVDKAAEAQRLEEANKSEIDKQYQKILEVGQNSIDEKNWDKAKEMFIRATNLRPEDIVPKNKLKEIDNLIKAEQDAKLNAAEKEKNYNSKINEAEQLASKKEYDKAISLFEHALSIKPEEKLPPKRIAELSELRTKLNELSKTENQYREFIISGDQAVQNKDYNTAIVNYENALKSKAGDKIATAKIAEVKQLMDNENLSKTKNQFDLLIKEGDDLFKEEKWKDARKKYEEALSLVTDDKYAKKQIDICIERIKKTPDESIQYQKLLTKADENFSKAKYDKARELYERALTLKSSDPYPQQKLDEIKAILNPKAVKKAEPLESLGESTIEDPEKVHEALVKAELERKNKKNTKLKSTSETIQNNTTQSSENKQTQILSSANTISEIEKKNQIRDTRADENRQNTVEQVNKKESDMNSFILDAGNQKYNENINNTEYVNIVIAEQNKLVTESTAVYEANSKTMKVVTKNVQDENNQTSSGYYQSNIKSQGELEKTQIQYSEKVQDDFDSRKAVERGVNKTKDGISVFDENSNIKESDNILNVSNELDDQNKKRELKFVEDAKLSGNNKEGLKGIETGVVNQEISNTEKTTEKVLKTDEIVNANHKSQVGIADNQDKVRQSNVELIKDGNKQISDNEGNTIQQNKTKNLDNQDVISKNIVKLDVIKDIEVNSANKKFDAVDKVDKQNATALVQNNMTDEEQRLYAKSTVSNIDQKNSSDVTEKGKKVDNNTSSMKTVTDELSSNKAKEVIAKEDQLKASQGLLDKISSKQIKYDDKVANELGTLYPEGVSQEVFEQKDENGLLKAVVTRRVVVKNGHGQVYVRTQSLTGITYSKNGNPSSEFVWQKETQDSKLAKHY